MSSASSIRTVHIRRALLLFAIVLGMAALAASLSRPPEETAPAPRPDAPAPTAGAPAPAAELPEPLVFEADSDRSRRLAAGQAATLEVGVEEAGSVEIPRLGLSASADQLTPARFEVLPSSPGRYRIIFTAADGDRSSPAGTLVVTTAG
jgi:hypothetical protein